MASQGPRSPASGTDDASIGSLPWADPGNITADDGSYATAVGNLVGTAQTEYLVAKDFGFSVPSTATINGIVVEWKRRVDNPALGAVADNVVSIVRTGAISATNLSIGAPWAGSDQYDPFGSSTELWGETWTPSRINATDFGATIAPDVDANVVAMVDHCRITVYYTPLPFNPATDAPRQLIQTRSRPVLPVRSQSVAIVTPSVMVAPVAEAWTVKAKASPPAKMPVKGAKAFRPEIIPPDVPLPFGTVTGVSARNRRLLQRPANRSTFALPLEQTPPFPDSWLTRSVGDKRSRPRLNRSWFVLPTERTPPNPDSWLTRIVGPTPRRAFAGRSVSLFQLVPYANDPISPWFNSRRVVMPKPMAGRTRISQVSAQEVLPFGLPIPTVRATAAQQLRSPGRRAFFAAGQDLIIPVPDVTVTKPVRRQYRGSTWFALTGAGEETDLGEVSFIASGKALPRKFVPSATITRILEPTGTGILTLGFLKPLVCRPVIRLGQPSNITHIAWTPRDIATTVRLDNRNAGGGVGYGQTSSGLGSRNQRSTGNT